MMWAGDRLPKNQEGVAASLSHAFLAPPLAASARVSRPTGAGGRVGPKPLIACALGQRIMDQDIRSVGITFVSPCHVMTVT